MNIIGTFSSIIYNNLPNNLYTKLSILNSELILSIYTTPSHPIPIPFIQTDNNNKIILGCVFGSVGVIIIGFIVYHYNSNKRKKLFIQKNQQELYDINVITQMNPLS